MRKRFVILSAVLGLLLQACASIPVNPKTAADIYIGAIHTARIAYRAHAAAVQANKETPEHGLASIVKIEKGMSTALLVYKAALVVAGNDYASDSAKPRIEAALKMAYTARDSLLSAIDTRR